MLAILGPLPSPLIFHNVKNHGGGGAEGEPGRIARNEEQKKQRKQHKTNRNKTKMKDTDWERDKQCSPCFLVKTSPAEGRRRSHKNTAYARFGVQVFRVFRVFRGVQGVQVFRC